MKRLNFKSILLVSVIVGLSITGCSKDDDDEIIVEKGHIQGLTASLGDNSHRSARLTWEDTAETGYNNYYEVFRAADGDEEFQRIENRGTDTHFTDRRHTELEFLTTYHYFVKLNERYSDTVSITTLNRYIPFITSGGARYDGGGDAATIEFLSISWRVGDDETTDNVDKFEIYRDGQLVGTDGYTSSYSNSYDFRDEDHNFEFDVDYSYTVTTFTSDGSEYESKSRIVTPQRPQEQDPPDAPEIIKVISDRSEQNIEVYITDESSSTNDVIGFYFELDLDGGDYYYWENTVSVHDLDVDDNENLIILLNASDVPLPLHSVDFNGNVRIKDNSTQLWSDWSNLIITTVF